MEIQRGFFTGILSSVKFMRVTFGWDDDGAVDVDIEDYH